jgi:ribosomal protein S18 acetylase RimI-like enzyme
MFANIDLARRIEAAEARLMAAIAEQARRHDPAGDVLCEPLGGGGVTYVRPDAPMNKLVGAGFDGPIDETRLDAIERAFTARRAPLQVELATLARCEAAQQLAGRGYLPVAFEHVLGRDLRAAPVAPAGHRVELARAAAGPWIECMADSFLAGDGTGAGSPDAFARAEIVRAMQELAAVPDVRRYQVCDGDTMAGGASMRLDPGGVALLCGAATVPARRRRGVQSALLAARLGDAAAAGCDVAVMTVQPGSRSQHNATRLGFALLYARAILVRPPT